MTTPQATAPAVYTKKPINYKVFGIKVGCAGVAGVIGASLTFPLDRAKTLLQLADKNPFAATKYTGVLNCIAVERRTNGFASLYKGLKPNLMLIIFEKALKLGVNDFVRNRLADDKTGKVSIPHGCLAGGTAGLAQSIVTTPMEYLKVQMQLDSKLSLGQLLKRVRLSDVYRGYTATIARDIPFSVIFFALYGVLEQDWATNSVTGEVELWKVLLSGAGAASVGAFVSTPMDVVKSNLQGTNPRHTTMGAEARALYREGGAKVFLRGWLPRCVSIGPLFGVTLLSYVVQKELVDKLKLDEE